MNPPWKDNRYSLIQWTCSYHKRRYRIRKTAIMQWYNPRLWSYRKTCRNVTHPSDASASRCRGSLFFPSNSGQESSAAAVLACAIVPSEKQTRGRAWLESHVYLSINFSIHLSNELTISLSICLSVYLSIKFSLYIYINISLSLCLSICLCLYPSISLFVLVSNYLSLCLCIYLSISPSISLAISLTIYLSVCPYLFLYLSVCPSIYVSICLSVHLSMYLSLSLSIYLSNYLSIYLYNIRTSKSGANMRCFVHFDLEMCFAPRRRALFRHLNFQKWSEAGVFCTFWLGNVLRATTACTFSTSQLPTVVRAWCVLYILTSKCASRHNGVQFFITHLASWLRTRRFSEPTFRPSGATNHWKNRAFRDFQCFTTFLPFRAPASSFFWSFLFWLFSPLLFNCPYCRKFHF